MVDRTCVVLGGSSQAGSWLVPTLIESGWTVHLISRGLKPRFDYGANGDWHKLDLRSMNAQFPAVEARVVFDMLGIASDWLEKMHGTGVRRVISFSSTSVLPRPNPLIQLTLERSKTCGNGSRLLPKPARDCKSTGPFCVLS